MRHREESDNPIQENKDEMYLRGTPGGRDVVQEAELNLARGVARKKKRQLGDQSHYEDVDLIQNPILLGVERKIDSVIRSQTNNVG